MPIDALVKKYFAVVVLGLVAMAAYFQAKGTTALLGGRVGPSAETVARLPEGDRGASDLASSARARDRSADPILKRNPFDSVTGPLDEKPFDGGSLPSAEADIDTNDPLGAPACDGVKVNIVTESPDPTWSLAAIQGSGEPKPSLRRVGDEVAGKAVAYIGYNWRENSPAVWLSQGSTLCQALLFSEAPVPVASPGGAAPATMVAPKGMAAPAGVPPEIASKIQKVSDTEFNVDRAVVDTILANQAELMRSARIVPEQKDGKVVGIRMFGIRPDTLLGHLGFQNGDRLEAINGFDMTSPEKALEAYARLRTAGNLNVKITRRGAPMNVDFRIK